MLTFLAVSLKLVKCLLALQLDGPSVSQPMCECLPLSNTDPILRGHKGARLFPLLASRISSQVYGATDSNNIVAKPRTRIRVQTSPCKPSANDNPSHLQKREVESGACHVVGKSPCSKAEKKK